MQQQFVVSLGDLKFEPNPLYTNHYINTSLREDKQSFHNIYFIQQTACTITIRGITFISSIMRQNN